MLKQLMPYGSWKSPISSDLVAADSIRLSEVLIEGGAAYWLESRTAEGGRSVVVRQAAGDADPHEVTAAGAGARTKVHEYGGGAWVVSGSVLFYSDAGDGRLYRQEAGGNPQPLTPSGKPHERRYADGNIDRIRNRWIGVREDHTDEGQTVNTIVAIDITGATIGPGIVIASGHDFFSSPRLSPDGLRLLWLAWDHPNMPWNGTTLYVVNLDADGLPAGSPVVVAGGPHESIIQAEWAPNGQRIYYLSDRTGWWNLYQADDQGNHRPLTNMAAEFGQPQWSFAMSSYAILNPQTIVCCYAQGGIDRLALLDVQSGSLSALSTPFTHFECIKAEGQRVLCLAGAAALPLAVVEFDIGAGGYKIYRSSVTAFTETKFELLRFLSPPETIEFPSGEERAFGLWYPPRNDNYAGADAERPPLLVRCHGGPTSQATSLFDARLQYWTSRGFSVLDVNYRGSSGFGRSYRDRLHREWGVVDVEDCINGAKYLADIGLVDPQRIVITGSSAGGYTALSALTFHDFFAGGASYYGVSDTAALVRETHKFESRYLDWLIGPYPSDAGLHMQRSPVFHAALLRKPVVFFQGAEDAVVPPGQTQKMVEAIRSNGARPGFVLFAGEQHGFRRSENIKRALDIELYFYAFNILNINLNF